MECWEPSERLLIGTGKPRGTGCLNDFPFLGAYNNNNNDLFIVIGLLPGGSGYFTCKQNMKLVTTKFKSGGLLEKHVVANCECPICVVRSERTQAPAVLKLVCGGLTVYVRIPDFKILEGTT